MASLRLPLPLDTHLRLKVQGDGDDLVLVVELVGQEAPQTRGLTVRQHQVAELLVSTGLSQKALATELGISHGSVRSHVLAIYRALKVGSRPELVATWGAYAKDRMDPAHRR